MLPIVTHLRRLYRVMTDLPLAYVHRAPDPETAPEGRPPAAFLLHDRAGDETDLLPVADVLPERYHAVGLRAPGRAVAGRAWYGLDLTAGREYETQPVPEDLERSLGLAADAVDGAARAFDFDRGRIGLVGLGQGAVTALALLVERPDAFAWACALHGYLPQTHVDRTPSGPGLDGTPVFVAAGSADEAVRPSRVERAADRLDELGADVTFSTYGAGHRPAPAEIHDAAAFATDHE